MASSEEATMAASRCACYLGALPIGDIHQHVNRAYDRARSVLQQRRIRNERDPHPVRALRGRFHPTVGSPFLQRDGHWALIVWKEAAIRPIELPRAAPLAFAEGGMMAPKGGRSGVVVGDEPRRIGHVNGGRKDIEDVAKITFATHKRLAGAPKKLGLRKLPCGLKNPVMGVAHGGPP